MSTDIVDSLPEKCIEAAHTAAHYGAHSAAVMLEQAAAEITRLRAALSERATTPEAALAELQAHPSLATMMRTIDAHAVEIDRLRAERAGVAPQFLPVAKVRCWEEPRYEKSPRQMFELVQLDEFRALPSGAHTLYVAAGTRQNESAGVAPESAQAPIGFVPHQGLINLAQGAAPVGLWPNASQCVSPAAVYTHPVPARVAVALTDEQWDDLFLQAAGLPLGERYKTIERASWAANSLTAPEGAAR